MNLSSFCERANRSLKRRFRSICLYAYNYILAPLPSGPRINKVKIFLLRLAGATVGKGCCIQHNVRFTGVTGLTIGNHVWIAPNVWVQCGKRIVIGDNVEVNYGTLLSANCGSELRIGDNCHIAHMCSLKCSTMVIDPTLEKDCIVCGDVFKNITIGKGTWIGAGVIVLPGVSVGSFNVIAAGAVVTKDSPDGVLLAGVPAVVKKYYLDKHASLQC